MSRSTPSRMLRLGSAAASAAIRSSRSCSAVFAPPPPPPMPPTPPPPTSIAPLPTRAEATEAPTLPAIGPEPDAGDCRSARLCWPVVSVALPAAGPEDTLLTAAGPADAELPLPPRTGRPCAAASAEEVEPAAAVAAGRRVLGSQTTSAAWLTPVPPAQASSLSVSDYKPRAKSVV